MKRLPFLAILVAAVACSDARPAPTVTIKGATIRVEWVRSDPLRRTATIRRRPLSEDRGILIGWSCDRIQHYFSSGTEGGFEVLFLAADGRIAERQSLPANSEEGVTSKAEARYALFLAEGWLARHGAGEGEKVVFSDAIASQPADPLPVVKLGDAALNVEVAASREDQARGLMHRRTMSADDGMIFVYRTDENDGFWMLNCHYPLDIAFFDKTGAFINMVPIDPYPDPKTDTGGRANASRPYRYVVETHKGWFRAKGLVDGAGNATRPFGVEIPASVNKLAERTTQW